MKRRVSASAKGGCGQPAVGPTRSWTETRASASAETNSSPARAGPTGSSTRARASACAEEPAREASPSTQPSAPVNVQKTPRSASSKGRSFSLRRAGEQSSRTVGISLPGNRVLN